MTFLQRATTALGVLLALSAPVRAQTSFLEFESGPVRPIALTPNGTRLLVCNIPDNQLEIFSVSEAGKLSHLGSVPVGMEPVSVAARSDTEAWVVNHLSDSVSIVDLASTPPRVTRTLLVGDEPRDIVFAGTGGSRAFITTAHRGQQRSNASLVGSRRALAALCSPLPACRAPTCGCGTRTTSEPGSAGRPCGSSASSRIRRARSRPTAPRCTSRRFTRAIRPPRSTSSRSAMDSPRRVPARRPAVQRLRAGSRVRARTRRARSLPRPA